MQTIDKLFVTLEIAKMMKEKGFDGECLRAFGGDELLYYSGAMSGGLYNHNLSTQYAAPTWWQAQAWLRDEHDIHVNPIQKKCYPDGYMGQEYYVNLSVKGSYCDDYDDVYWGYEQALEAGIIAGLELVDL